MTNPTPDRLRTIEALASEFDKYWYFDGKNKEIRLKKFSVARKAVNLFWKKRFSVFAMYCLANKQWASSELICYKFPLNHENMPIHGFPIKYELQGGWTIPSRELSFLMHGPLASEGLHTVLVPPTIGWQRVVLLVKQLSPLVTGAIAIGGTLIRYWPEAQLAIANVF